MKSISLKKFIEENTPKGMEYDPDNSTPENIVFREKAKSTRWEDLETISGFRSDYDSDICLAVATTPLNRSLYATKAQCEAHLAQAQLTLIIKRVNGHWEPDWTDSTQTKWCIILYRDSYVINNIFYCNKFLTFKTEELAEQILRENQDLLEQYKPLAG